MSDTDDLEAIRERKLQELREKAESGELGAEEDAEPTTTTAPDEPIEFSGGSLTEMVGQYDVALVDFYADWCGPCQMMEDPIGRLAANTDAAVVKVDADRHQRVCQQFGVQGLPTLLVFANGERTDRLVGAQTEGTLRKAVRNA